MYIESVKYTEPYSLQLIGGDDERLETFLAQRGIRTEDDMRDASRTDFFPRDRPIVTPYPPQVTNPSTGGYDVLYPCGQVPLGGIIMWSGAITDIDTECWHLCDGTPPTPDLRDRFIVGAGGSYAVGDTGGEDTSDLSHTHGVGTLAAANESSHTHGIGSYAAANESSHTHADGTYAAANDTHSHDVTGTSASDTHNHTEGSLDTDLNPAHTHDDGTLITAGPSATQTVQSGGGINVASDSHIHSISGSTGSAGLHKHTITGAVDNDAHSHGDGTYAAANDTHNHDVTGTSAVGSAHTHSLSGTSAAGSAHTHQIAGNTDTGGLVAHDNRPSYYSLAFIMRIA